MKKWLVIASIACLSLILIWSRISHLNSGIVIVEPDEWYFSVGSESLANSWMPNVKGKPLLEHPPFFEYLGHFLSIFAPHSNSFAPTRLISVISSFILAACLFFYLRRKVNLRTAVFSLLFFTLIPLSVFYGKLALREMLLLLMVFSYYWVAEKANEDKNNWRPAILAGLFLGLSIWVKTTAVIFILKPIVTIAFYFGHLIWENHFRLNAIIKKGTNYKGFVQPIINRLLTLGTGLGIAVVGFIPGYLYSPLQLKNDLIRSTINHSSTSLTVVTQNWSYYLGYLDYWLTWPVILSAVIGLLYIFKNKPRRWEQLLSFIVVILILLTFNEPRARYFVLLLPFITILAALGLNYLVELTRPTYRFAFSTVLLITVVLAMLPGAKVAYDSTNHSLVEQAIAKIKSWYPDPNSITIFSSFWPPIIQDASGYPTARLTRYKDDANRDFYEYPNFSPKFNDHPANFFFEKDHEGLFVFFVVKPLEANDLAERKQAVEVLEGRNQPILAEITDNKPNFPEKTLPYTIYLYNNLPRP